MKKMGLIVAPTVLGYLLFAAFVPSGRLMSALYYDVDLEVTADLP